MKSIFKKLEILKYINNNNNKKIERKKERMITILQIFDLKLCRSD